jgi:hypothetical protein
VTRPKRIRRPFKYAARKPTRTELIALLRRIHGPKLPRFDGSPYAGTRFDAAELILHELAHASQIPGALPVRHGRMHPSWDEMHDYLEKKLPRAVADWHEVRAVAIVLGASRSLRLPLERYRLVTVGAKNSYSYKLYKDRKRFDHRVSMVENSQAVRVRVQRVLDILDRAWARRRSPV